jgi:hypothetical protein
MGVESILLEKLFFLGAKERLKEAPFVALEKKVFKQDLVTDSRKKLLKKIENRFHLTSKITLEFIPLRTFLKDNSVLC